MWILGWYKMGEYGDGVTKFDIIRRGPNKVIGG